jgi:DNA-binding MarR family transcriptional regulator
VRLLSMRLKSGTEDSKWSGRKRPAQGGKQDSFALQLYIVLRYNSNAGWIGTRYNQRMKRLTLSDYQALAEFRYQIRRFLHFSEQVVKQAGLERGQYQLMLAIKGMPAGVRPRIRELANRMEIRHHSAVELVNRLEAGGFVHRTRAQDDRREVLLALTPRGEQVLAELALHHHDELRSAGPELVAALRRVMREGNDAGPQQALSPPSLDKVRNSKHP